MAIIFLQQKNFQKTLVAVFVFIVIITLVIIWQGFFKKETTIPFEEPSLLSQKEIRINFNELISQDLKDLVPFPAIEPFKEIPASETEEGEQIPGVTIGRENPFLPY